MGASGAGSGGRVAPVDGPRDASDRRRQRASRTHTLILEALIDLVDAGDPQPSARAIAEQAGVARRSVFHHFADVNHLYLAAVDLQVSRHDALVAPVQPKGAIESRVGLLCHQRRELFEAVGPVIRAASARSADPAGIDRHLADHRVLLRRQLAETLAPELQRRGTAAGVLLDALEMATGWTHWQALRFETRHPAAAAEQLMAYEVKRLLR